MSNSLIIIAALALLGGLLYFEKRDNPAGVLLTKAPLSALFILAAAQQPQTHRTYYLLLLAGLGLCLVGDICLYLCCPQSIHKKGIPKPARRASTVLLRTIFARLFHRQSLNIAGRLIHIG